MNEHAQPYEEWIGFESEWSVRAAQGRIPAGRPPEWWMGLSLREFEERANALDEQEITRTIAEMKQTITRIQAQQEARGRGDGRWWQRASGVRTSVVAKRRILGNILYRMTPRLVPRADRLKALQEARVEAEAGKVGPALVRVIDILARLWSQENKTP